MYEKFEEYDGGTIIQDDIVHPLSFNTLIVFSKIMYSHSIIQAKSPATQLGVGGFDSQFFFSCVFADLAVLVPRIILFRRYRVLIVLKVNCSRDLRKYMNNNDPMHVTKAS